MANIRIFNEASFFNFFLLPHCASEIDVPIEFEKKKGETLQPEIKLTTDVDDVGKWWSVKTARAGNYCCLREGWTVFVQDVGLLHRDTLVFTFLGNSAFHVSVYGGVSRCSKFPAATISIGDEDSGNLKRKVRTEPAAGKEKESDPTLRFCREVKSYFVSSSPQAMYIPKGFAVSTGIATSRNILLVNGAGKQWPVTVIAVNSSKGYGFSGGFKKFLVDNNVAVGTTVSYEFLPNSGNMVKALW